MGYFMFFVAVVAASLLWSATCIAAAARTQRTWLRRVLVAAAVLVPLLALVPWVGLTWLLASNAKLQVNWFAPTVTVFLAALVGALWIRAAGLSRRAGEGDFVAAGWPVVGLAAMFVLAKAVAFGTLLFIDNTAAAEGRALRVEAAQLMASSLPPAPAADDDAAPLYLRAFAAIEADSALVADDSPASKPGIADVASPAVTAILSRHAATLDLLRQAADRSGCRFVRDWSRPSISMTLPEMAPMRKAAKLLALAARREAAEGEAAAGLHDVVRLHRMGLHAAADPILVCGLWGQAIDLIALETLADVLPALQRQDLPLLDDQARTDFPGTPLSYQRHFLGEEAFGLAMLADLADGRHGLSMLALLSAMDGSGPREWFGSEPLSFLFRCFLLPSDMASYRAIMRRYQEITAAHATGRPYPDVKQQSEEIADPLATRRKGIFTALMVPALASVVRSQAQGQARHRAAEMLVAITRERVTTGRLPETPESLVPGIVPAVPRDPFTVDQPLLTKWADDAWLVYSVGPDGEDDGGPRAPGTDAVEGNDDIGLRLATPAHMP
ncbi:MAG: hypothetical protein K8S94_01770 [Planctomycetia bacterium]|nr:hypothetical protein [Planctomycetia bacterium]